MNLYTTCITCYTLGLPLGLGISIYLINFFTYSDILDLNATPFLVNDVKYLSIGCP